MSTITVCLLSFIWTYNVYFDFIMPFESSLTLLWEKFIVFVLTAFYISFGKVITSGLESTVVTGFSMRWEMLIAVGISIITD